jgi:hypothetical protein
MDIPNKEEGILAEIEPHVFGPAKHGMAGGYFTTMTIGGSTISPCLESRLKGPKTPKYAAFFTRLWIEDNTLLLLDLVVDAPEGASAATKLNSLIDKGEPTITFTGKVGAYMTLSTGSGVEVLTEVNIQGKIYNKYGELHFHRKGKGKFGTSHDLRMFEVGIVPDKSTDLQINYGGTDKGVWTFGPLTT